MYEGAVFLLLGDMQEVLVQSSDCALAPNGGNVCAIWTQESSAAIFLL